MTEDRQQEKLPRWLEYREGENERSPVRFIDLRGTGFDPDSPEWRERVNGLVREALAEMEGDEAPEWREPVLVKTHIGEPKVDTRLDPEFSRAPADYARGRGLEKIAVGDTTVAYTGPRGYKENSGPCPSYMELAGKHGWNESGPLGAPFVVLDRPETSAPGILEFKDEEVLFKPGRSNIFREISLAGGFAAAGTIVNNVHFTLHDMAQVACAVKGLTMGGSGYRGKVTMHRCYLPEIDPEECTRCGLCARSCPEGALAWGEGEVPTLDREKCIGCGECSAVCPVKCIDMVGTDIDDWERGSDTLPFRMADYIMGMMEGRWDRLVNIVHLYNITRGCDCLDKRQKTIAPHIGVIIGRNPFAVDLMATRLMHEEFHRTITEAEGEQGYGPDEALRYYFKGYHGTGPYDFIRREYGVVVEPEPDRVESAGA